MAGEWTMATLGGVVMPEPPIRGSGSRPDDWTRIEMWLVKNGLREHAGTVAHYELEREFGKVREQVRAEIIAASTEEPPSGPDGKTMIESHCWKCVRCQAYRKMADEEARTVGERTVAAIVTYAKATARRIREEVRDGSGRGSLATSTRDFDHAAAWERAAEFIEAGHWKDKQR